MLCKYIYTLNQFTNFNNKILHFRKASNDLIGLNLFQSNDPSPNPVQQYNSLNSPTSSLTNKSISPTNSFPSVSRYAAGNSYLIAL